MNVTDETGQDAHKADCLTSTLGSVGPATKKEYKQVNARSARKTFKMPHSQTLASK